MAAVEFVFYFDEMTPRAIANQLDLHGCRTVMAVDVGMSEKTDPEHLRYATEHNAVLVTFDRPFAGRAMQQKDHAGLVCWVGAHNDIGGIVLTLLRFAEEHTPDEVRGRVF